MRETKVKNKINKHCAGELVGRVCWMGNFFSNAHRLRKVKSQRLRKNIVNQKEKEAELQAEVNVEAMERMADMDLADGSDFPMRNKNI